MSAVRKHAMKKRSGRFSQKPLETYEDLKLEDGNIKELKILLLGASAVGKTAIIRQSVESLFKEDYEPTCMEPFQKNVHIEGITYVLAMNDMGTVFSESIRDVQIKQAECFIVIYSITSQSSFDEAREILEKIHELKQTKNVPVLLVGNKVDLEDERSVSEKVGLSLAGRFGTGFVEISARNEVQVNDAFEKAVEIHNLVEMFHTTRNNNNNNSNSKKSATVYKRSHSDPNHQYYKEKCVIQ